MQEILATSSMPGSPRAFNLWRFLSKNHALSRTAPGRSPAAALAGPVATTIAGRDCSKAKVRLAPQSRLLLGFLALALVTFPLATNWFYAYQFAYLIALTLVGYFAIVYILGGERDLRTFFAWLIGIHIYLATQGIHGYSAHQFNNYGYTSTGKVGEYFLGDENDLALAARRMFATSPIWGIGGDNGRVLMPEYSYEFPIERRMNYWGKAFHSLYYQLLAEFGLLGIVLIGSVVVLNARDLRQIRALGRKGRCSDSIEQLANCLQLSWVGLLVSGALISVLGYPHLYYLTAPTVVVHRLGLQESMSPQPEPSAAKRRAIRRWSTT